MSKTAMTESGVSWRGWRGWGKLPEPYSESKMGMFSYAVNRETHQCYELGKGAWHLLAEDRADKMADTSEYDNTVSIVRSVIAGWDVPADYADHIARALQGLGPTLEIVNDMIWDDPIAGCEIVGTRYVETARV